MPSSAPEFLEVVTTTETEEDAKRIAAELIGRRLAACAQVLGPVTSVYRWEGAVETANEYQCVAKCRAQSFDRVAASIRELHPYDVPQIIALPIVAAITEYREWMREETQ